MSVKESISKCWQRWLELEFSDLESWKGLESGEEAKDLSHKVGSVCYRKGLWEGREEGWMGTVLCKQRGCLFLWSWTYGAAQCCPIELSFLQNLFY